MEAPVEVPGASLSFTPTPESSPPADHIILHDVTKSTDSLISPSESVSVSVHEDLSFDFSPREHSPVILNPSPTEHGVQTVPLRHVRDCCNAFTAAMIHVETQTQNPTKVSKQWRSTLRSKGRDFSHQTENAEPLHNSTFSLPHERLYADAAIQRQRVEEARRVQIQQEELEFQRNDVANRNLSKQGNIRRSRQPIFERLYQDHEKIQTRKKEKKQQYQHEEEKLFVAFRSTPYHGADYQTKQSNEKIETRLLRWQEARNVRLKRMIEDDFKVKTTPRKQRRSKIREEPYQSTRMNIAVEERLLRYPEVYAGKLKQRIADEEKRLFHPRVHNSKRRKRVTNYARWRSEGYDQLLGSSQVAQ